jgi:hypothetical protein
MIKIEHPDLDKIATKYFDSIKSQIQARSRFIIHIIDALYNGLNPDQLLNFRSIHGKTRVSIVNTFLRNNKLQNQTHYANVAFANRHLWLDGYENMFRNLATYLEDENHIRQLLLCNPDLAIATENNFKANIGLPAVLPSQVKDVINIIIDYSLFNQYAYGIAKKLNVNTCPYCNRNYINTVIDKKGEHIIRPTFDHFFPQKLHPFLALSFYNLIPSCYYCNSSLKSSATISIDTHIHPYKEGFDKDATFHVLISNLKPNKSDPENFTLLFADNMTPLALNDRYRKIFGGVRRTENPDEGNINLFKLKDIYQSHLDIVGELVVKCDKLSSSYANSLQTLFSSLGTSREEFYQYYFGNYFNEKNFHRRPMAKLSKDVVSQIIPNFVK